MRDHKRCFILLSMTFSVHLFLAVLVFGREYSTEITEPTVGATELSPPIPARVSLQAKRSVVIYSTEDIAESPSRTGPMTTETRDHTVSRTRMTPDTPHRPEAPGISEMPEGDGCCYGGGYPVAGGAMHIRPGLYLAGWRSCSHDDERWLWPALLGTDIIYSWSGNSGHGEFTYWPYGYLYSWGDTPTYRDALAFDQARSAMQSDPNATDGDCIPYNSAEDVHPSDYGSAQPGDVNEMVSGASKATAISKQGAAKGG